jgi:UDP-N-acetylglucosamine enolpyruvyl transferase
MPLVTSGQKAAVRCPGGDAVGRRPPTAGYTRVKSVGFDIDPISSSTAT